MQIRIASAAIDGIVGRILETGMAGRPVPFAALVAPLARHFAGELDAHYAHSRDHLVIERIAAVRSRALADGQVLAAEPKATAEAKAVLRLFAGSDEAFRCELQQLVVPSERLGATANAGARPAASAHCRFSVGVDEHLTYAEASGDFNPLHMDRDLCGRLSMPERIIHGTLLATLAETIAEAGATGQMTVRFASPCFVSEALSATRHDRPGGGRRVIVHGADSRIVCALDWRA